MILYVTIADVIFLLIARKPNALMIPRQENIYGPIGFLVYVQLPNYMYVYTTLYYWTE